MPRTWSQRILYARTFSKESGLDVLLKTARDLIVWSLDGIPFNIMFRRFRRLAARTVTAEEALDLVWGFEYYGASIAPLQSRSEISALLGFVKELRPKTVLEIGTARGGTLYLFTRVASQDALFVSVDLPGGAFGGGYDARMLPMMKTFAQAGQRIEFMRSDSHSAETLGAVRKALEGRTVDFLFIDGDHRYEGVRKDFEMYSPLVRKGGIVAFHDVCEGPEDLVGGVPKFWKEVSVSRNTKTIIEDPRQGRFGIGVIFV